MNIPLGGVGNMATHHDDGGTFKHEIGTEGAMIDPATGKVKKETTRSRLFLNTIETTKAPVLW